MDAIDNIYSSEEEEEGGIITTGNIYDDQKDSFENSKREEEENEGEEDVIDNENNNNLRIIDNIEIYNDLNFNVNNSEDGENRDDPFFNPYKRVIDTDVEYNTSCSEDERVLTEVEYYNSLYKRNDNSRKRKRRKITEYSLYSEGSRDSAEDFFQFNSDEEDEIKATEDSENDGDSNASELDWIETNNLAIERFKKYDKSSNETYNTNSEDSDNSVDNTKTFENDSEAIYKGIDKMKVTKNVNNDYLENDRLSNYCDAISKKRRRSFKSYSECFGCSISYMEIIDEDFASDSKAVRGVMDFIHSNYGKVDDIALAKGAHLLFKNTVYLPRRKRGLPTLMWRTEMIYRHITKHSLDPHIYIGRCMKDCIKNQEIINKLLYTHNISEDGDTSELELNHKNMEQYVKIITLILNLYKSDPEKMLFFNDKISSAYKNNQDKNYKGKGLESSSLLSKNLQLKKNPVN